MGEWKVERPPGAKYIYVLFKGEMTPAEGGEAATKAKELMGSDNVALMANFMELSKYATEVRTAFQKILLPNRKQLTGLTVATDNFLVRMGVSTFALFMGMRAHIVDREEDLEAAIEALRNEGPA